MKRTDTLPRHVTRWLHATGVGLRRRLIDSRSPKWLKAPQAVMARVVSQMARTGIGTDECLRYGCLPVPVHYYSPIPDVGDLAARRVWDRRSALPGIDFREKAQLELLAELGRAYGAECRWTHEPGSDPSVFFTDNTSFSYGCAASTHGVLRKYKPRRVIEIGSGSSSRVIAAALRLNADHGGDGKAEYMIVDPYAAADLDDLPGVTRIIRRRVECLDVDVFGALGAHDVLFVDSGHTVRIGGDVNFLILEVLPRLATGVAVHFHDIPLPYEYSEAYATNARFRMFWTEAYLLQAFLCHNKAWEILLALNFLMRDHPQAYKAAWPAYDPAIHRLISHSFWIRRVAE